ncbi:hypothetical protein BCR35DRAFT_299873 [Leucosporidium creatinivorum]|uniref:Uncharacterized protein n=1 Tax=Leucosporidium creatinivorum TaxID=106004 RepID=A0A1Y2G115_9BASI|nr:hypothetical protein BCR35DRAFT_299873 [Leucosporidium creatinivorum]
MVRISPSLLLLAAAAAPHVQAASPSELLSMLPEAGRAIGRGVLKNVLRLDDEKVERIMKNEPAQPEPHPYALDLKDDNWETVIRTGTYNPLAAPLEKDTVWIINVYGPDTVSRQASEAFEAVALHNSSEGGGDLPKHFRFARLNYNTETVLPTRWWMWKPPMLVIATDNLRTLRFFSPNQVPPFHVPTSNLIAAREFWDTLQPWNSPMAPGGALESTLVKVADAWAWYHQTISKIPSFVLLALSGVLANLVIGFFHKSDTSGNKAQEALAAAQAKLAKEKAEAEAKAAAEKKKDEEALKEVKGADSVEDSGEESLTTGVRRGKPRAAKRK